MIAYHTTTRANLESILSNGLVPGICKGFTEEGTWANVYYGGAVNHVSLNENDKWNGANPSDDQVFLRIDITGLPLMSDLPSLISEGGMYVEEIDNAELGYGWFEDDQTWVEFEDELERIALKDFINNPSLVSFATKFTGTATIKELITPDRIQVLAYESI